MGEESKGEGPPEEEYIIWPNHGMVESTAVSENKPSALWWALSAISTSRKSRARKWMSWKWGKRMHYNKRFQM